ncbi:MAG: DUF5693 family protein [Phascolarctobacterium sp.]|nr:DUF5693 family protein [Phascolarctobacterium sp.]
MKSRYNIVLIAVIVLGFVCSLWLNLTRHTIEQKNDTVEMSMEYENLRRLAALEGLPENVVLEKFKAAGVNTIMIFDTTLNRLAKHGVIDLATEEELRDQLALGGKGGVFAPAVEQNLIQTNAAYIAEKEDKETFSDVLEDLALRYGKERVKLIAEQPRRVAMVLGSTSIIPEYRYDEPFGVLQAPLGLPRADMRRVAAAGFNVAIRPQNYVGVNEEKIDAIFKRVADSGVKVHAYMPCGKEVIGYPNKIGYMGKKMQEHKMNLIMLEHYTQLRFANIDGIVELSEANNYNASRSYVIDELEQKKITVGTALHRWAITDEERNIRVNYLRPFFLPRDGKDLMTLNLEYVKNIRDNVKARGYKIDKAGVFADNKVADYAPYFPNKLYFLPIVAAILAGVTMYLSLVFGLSKSKELMVWAALTAVGCGIMLVGRGLLLRQMLALVAAVVFPVLSMNVIFDIWDKNKKSDTGVVMIIVHGMWQLALAIALSLVGAAFLSGILTDTRFLLEIDIYRGVKLTFMLPIILVAMLYVQRYKILQQLTSKMDHPVAALNKLADKSLTFKHVAILLVLLIVLLYFVGRSGHTGGVPVPAIELKMRAFLEQVMYARPREKEFMIGHPAFFLAVMAAYRMAPRLWQFALVCAAVIGQGSLVQTFCHMRTPVIMSFVRALDGYAVGVVFGIVGVLFFAATLPFVMEFKRRYLNQ